MPIAAIRIDEAMWDAADRARRYEWRQALTDFIDEHRAVAELLHLRIAVDRGDTCIEAASPGGEPFARILIPRGALEAHFREYLAIIRDLGAVHEGAGSSRFEALDIAKRISHDEGAEALQALTRPLGLDHRSCRRLFTLLVTLHFDTTRLVVAHRRPS